MPKKLSSSKIARSYRLSERAVELINRLAQQDGRNQGEIIEIAIEMMAAQREGLEHGNSSRDDEGKQ